MFTILLSVHLVICVFLVIIVLLQKSEGGGLGIGQSGGGIGDFMSSRGTANFLTKSTTFLAVCFFLTSFGLAFHHMYYLYVFLSRLFFIRFRVKVMV